MYTISLECNCHKAFDNFFSQSKLRVLSTTDIVSMGHLWEEKITENRTYLSTMFVRQSSASNLHAKNNKKADEELYR